MVLKECFYAGASLCRLCVSNVFDVKALFDMDTSHVFPQGLLDVITLIGLVVGVEGSKACARCEVGLLLCSVAITTLSGVWSAPQLLE